VEGGEEGVLLGRGDVGERGVWGRGLSLLEDGEGAAVGEAKEELAQELDGGVADPAQGRRGRGDGEEEGLVKGYGSTRRVGLKGELELRSVRRRRSSPSSSIEEWRILQYTRRGIKIRQVGGWGETGAYSRFVVWQVERGQGSRSVRRRRSSPKSSMEE
jgi:hypothetical protein